MLSHSTMSHGGTSGPQPLEPSTAQSIAEPWHTSTLASTEQPNTFSNTYPSSGTINLSRTNSAPEDQIIKWLESTVFRGGNTTKMNMITSILGILEENTHVSITQSQKEVTFDSYLTKILSIQSTLNGSRDPDTSRSEHIQLLTNLSETNDRRISKNHEKLLSQTQMTMKINPTKNKNSLRTTCPGLFNLMTLPLSIVTPTARKCYDLWTIRKINCLYLCLVLSKFIC